jgi:hypothetical protein
MSVEPCSYERYISTTEVHVCVLGIIIPYVRYPAGVNWQVCSPYVGIRKEAGTASHMLLPVGGCCLARG